MPNQRFDNLGSVGLTTDPLPSLLPPVGYTTLDNVANIDGSIGNINGEELLRSNIAIEPLYQSSFQDVGGSQWFVVSDGARVFVYDIDGNEEEITPAVQWSRGFVSFPNLNNILIVNSASDGPFYWGGTGTDLVALPGWGAGWRCKYMATLRYNIVALNMTEGGQNWPYKIRWSNSAQEGDLPTQWDVLPSNDAGDDLLGETEGHIVGAANVRDSLWIVKADAVYDMSYIGPPYIFRTQRLHGGIGTRVQRGFAEVRGSMILATSSDVLLFDGQQSRSIVDNRIRRDLFNNLSEVNWQAMQVHFHPPTSKVYIGLPDSDTDPYLGLSYVWDLDTDTWYRRNLPRVYGFVNGFAAPEVAASIPTWDELDSPGARWVGGADWDSQLDGPWDKGAYLSSVDDLVMFEYKGAGDYDISFQSLNTTDSDGKSRSCVVERQGMPIEGAAGLAMITHLYPEATSNNLLNAAGEQAYIYFRFGGQEQPQGPITWETNFDGTPRWHRVLPGVTGVLDPRVTGRFLCWRIESTVRGAWRVGAITIEWQPVGDH